MHAHMAYKGDEIEELIGLGAFTHDNHPISGYFAIAHQHQADALSTNSTRIKAAGAHGLPGG